MGVDPASEQPRRRDRRCGQRAPGRRRRRGADAVHAGVDLEVHAEVCAPRGRPSASIASAVPTVGVSRLATISGELARPAARYSTRIGASIPPARSADALGRSATHSPAAAGLDGRRGDGDRAVAVAVGLDDGPHLGRGRRPRAARRRCGRRRRGRSRPTPNGALAPWWGRRGPGARRGQRDDPPIVTRSSSHASPCTTARCSPATDRDGVEEVAGDEAARGPSRGAAVDPRAPAAAAEGRAGPWRAGRR